MMRLALAAGKGATVLAVMLGVAGLAEARPGDLDSGFGRFGIASLTSPFEFTAPGIGASPNQVSPREMEAYPDGGILVVGDVRYDADRNFFVSGGAVRYDRDGALDRAFGQAGRYVYPGRSTFTAGAVDRTGRAVIAATIDRGGAFRLVLLRLLRDGTLDPSFGSGGEVEVASIRDANELVAQADGSLLFGATTTTEAGSRTVHVGRVTAGGVLDPSFGQGGIASIPMDAMLYGVAPAPDGDIVAAGSATAGTNSSDALLMRLQPDGQLDTSFGNQGFTRTQFRFPDGPAPGNSFTSLALLPDGRIVAGGTTRPLSYAEQPAFAGFLPDGSPDTSLSRNGQNPLNLGGWASMPEDGLIVGPGPLITFVADQGAHSVIVRYDRSGFDRGFAYRGRKRVAANTPEGLLRRPDGRLALTAWETNAECGFGMDVIQFDGRQEPDVRVTRARLRGHELALALRSATRTRVRGRARVLLDTRTPEGGNQRGSYCSQLREVAHRRFRIRRRGQVALQLSTRQSRDVRRAGELVVRVTSGVGSRRGRTARRLRLR